MKNELQSLIESAVKETGVSIKGDAAGLALYTAERTAVLATLVGQPGYDQAVIAERDNVALKAGLNSVGQVDAARDRVIGVIQGALFIGAGALAKAAGPTSGEGGL